VRWVPYQQFELADKVPRNALYMASLSASRHNPVLSDFYQRLRKTGKPNYAC
jgi:hypothetical protein